MQKEDILYLDEHVDALCPVIEGAETDDIYFPEFVESSEQVTMRAVDGTEFHISACDFERVVYYGPWHINGTNISVTRYLWNQTFLHRLILSTPKGLEVDHIDGNGLNCTRENLRSCTRQQNTWNRRKRRGTKYKYIGVQFNEYPKDRPWSTGIFHRGAFVHLGYFAKEVEAARVYDAKCIELRGKFSALNFPEVRRGF